MTQKTIYVSLSQFCESDARPRKILLDAGFKVLENKTGRRIKTEEMVEAMKEADGVLAAVEPYTSEILKALPKLKCISRCGAGTDAIDLEAAKGLNIKVLATADEVIEPVAQMTIAMMLALIRNFPEYAHDFKNGLWKKYTGFLLSELSVGLVGFGKIARRVAFYLKAFGSKILVSDPYLDKSKILDGMEVCDFDSLLKKSDIISLHLSRPASEGPLMGQQEFLKMKRGSFLINTARGFLVDERALTQALENKHLAGVAMDVFEKEPYTGPLAKFPNVLPTAHVATLTRASRIAMEVKCAQNIADFFKENL